MKINKKRKNQKKNYWDMKDRIEHPNKQMQRNKQTIKMCKIKTKNDIKNNNKNKNCSDKLPVV